MVFTFFFFLIKNTYCFYYCYLTIINFIDLLGIILNLSSIIIYSVSRADFNIDINNYLIPILKSCLNFNIEKAAEEAIEAASNIVSKYDNNCLIV